jgi:COP9 signalosome complex subunit 7
LITFLVLENASELENLVITAIYAGLLTGTLDPYHQHVCISSTSSLRDVSVSSIPSLIMTLHEWSSRCSSTLSDLEEQITSIKSDSVRRKREEKEWAAKVDKLIDGEKESKGPASKKGEGAVKRGFFGGNDADEGDMDLDSDDTEVDEKRGAAGLKKKRGLGGVGLGFGGR